METIQLRELRIFLTLADELHFGRTAQRLGLTSSRVSQSLRELENKLGRQLLHRTSRRVGLTPFGERFLAEAGPAYRQLAGVLERARASNERLEGTLRLGLLFPTAGGPHLTAVIQTFEERHPGCEVQLREVMFDDLLGPLRRGEVDLLATRLPIDRPDIAVGPTLSREPRVLQVARDHPLTAQERVSIEDIADHHVMPLEGFPAETVEAVIPHTTPRGRPIRRRQLGLKPRTPFEVEALIARGLIVHPTVPSYAEYFRHPDIVHLPIHDMPPVTTGLVWRHGSSDPRLHEFVRVTRQVVGRSSPTPQEAPAGGSRDIRSHRLQGDSAGTRR